MKKAVTITILFEADALNRDERTGNIISIKKLTRGVGEVYSYISRPAIRHYLWVTLYKTNPERWKPAPVKRGEGNIIQFDITNANIQDFAELDIFGYMATDERKANTRKACIGITKAVSLEPWKGDMGFYANHDLVRRYVSQNPEEPLEPNPYNCEEHKTLYKVSFTLDCEKVGINEKRELVIDEREKRERIFDILDAIHNGLYYHTGGECPGIVPLFLIAGIVKLPIPVFHTFVDIEFYQQNNRPKFKVREDFLKNGIYNGWIEMEDNKRLVFINPREPEAISSDFVNEHSYFKNWEEFKEMVGK